eukprot:scaffold2849_cov17-Tisochrysis_lutea.AAC.1
MGFRRGLHWLPRSSGRRDQATFECGFKCHGWAFKCEGIEYGSLLCPAHGDVTPACEDDECGKAPCCNPSLERTLKLHQSWGWGRKSHMSTLVDQRTLRKDPTRAPDFCLKGREWQQGHKCGGRSASTAGLDVGIAQAAHHFVLLAKGPLVPSCACCARSNRLGSCLRVSLRVLCAAPEEGLPEQQD